jgi:hypothetical protein
LEIGKFEGLDSPPERIAPDATVELVFHYGDPIEMRFAGDHLAAQPRSSAVTLTRGLLKPGAFQRA